MATLLVSTPVVRLKEDVEDSIYNFRPTDTPLTSSIKRKKVNAVYHEWTADTYRAPVLTNAAIEGAAATFAAATQPVQYNNRTQIFQDTISVSGTAEAVGKYGRKSEVDRLKIKKGIEVKKDIELAAIANPVAVTDNGTDTGGKMRGLYGWIATNDSLSTAGSPASPNPTSNTAPTAGTLRAFDEADLKTVIQGVYENGGDHSVLMLSPSHKGRSSTFSGNVQRTNEVGKGGDVVLQTSYGIYGSDYGPVKVVPNRVMANSAAGTANTAYVLDYDKISLGQLRSFQTTELARTGDSEQHQILTEVTLIVGQESTLGAIRDLTATGAAA